VPICGLYTLTVGAPAPRQERGESPAQRPGILSLPSGAEAVAGGRCRRPAGPCGSAVVGLVRCRCCTLLLHSALPLPGSPRWPCLPLDANWWRAAGEGHSRRSGPGGAARALVHVQIASQIAGQIALTDPPRRLSLWVPPRTGAGQSALRLKETYGRGTEGKEGTVRVASILRSAAAGSGSGAGGVGSLRLHRQGEHSDNQKENMR